MKVTLKDISLDTGYSISTVSRVLNGNEKISNSTHRKVFESAEKLGYKFSPGSIIHKETVNILLVASGFHEGEFYPSFFNGLNRASKTNKVNLFLHAVLPHDASLVKTLHTLASDFYDGVIIFIPELTHKDYILINENLPNNFPVISNSLIENPVFPTVTFDSYSGGYLAAQYFEKKGYKNLGLIMGPHERSESRFRKNGFLDYLTQTEELSCIWKCVGDFTYESGISAFDQFHKSIDKPEAIFACNDTMALAFMESAKASGYSVPDDIAVLGYDDLPHNKHTMPTLSSIRTDYEKLGNLTIKTLLEKISLRTFNTTQLSFVSVDVSSRESA